MKEFFKNILSLVIAIGAVLIIIAGSAAFAVVGSMIGVVVLVALGVIVIWYGIKEAMESKKPKEEPAEYDEHASM